MGLKKRSKVSAEFSMSSLTDIIFLLLIFFMLTSTLVSPHSLNMKLPGSGNPGTSDSNPPEIEISRSGDYKLNGRRVKAPVKDNLVRLLREEDRKNGSKKLDVIVSPERNTAIEHLVLVLDIFSKLGIEPIVAAQE